MRVLTVTAVALFAPVDALLRFPCAQLVIDRLDRLVTPGQAPSPHLHQILGGVRAYTPERRQRTDCVVELLQHHNGPSERYAWRIHMHIMPIQRRLLGTSNTTMFHRFQLAKGRQNYWTAVL